MNKRIEHRIGSGKTALQYEIIFLGKDILIIIGGGDIHIGCTAIGDKGSISSYTAAHHRDDVLAISLAQEVSKYFSCICTVVAGFHLDSITKDDIQKVIKNEKKGIKEIIKKIEKSVF